MWDAVNLALQYLINSFIKKMASFNTILRYWLLKAINKKFNNKKIC